MIPVLLSGTSVGSGLPIGFALKRRRVLLAACTARRFRRG